jgi:hypothetical protein
MPKLRITRDLVQATYTYLAESPPYDRWNLPEVHEIGIRVTRKQADYFGQFELSNSRAWIEISVTHHSTLFSLQRTLAHEMIHLHQWQNGMVPADDRGFMKMAKVVCDLHGYDFGVFCSSVPARMME